MKITGLNLNKITNMYKENTKPVKKTDDIIKNDSIEISSVGRSLSSIPQNDIKISSDEKVEAIRNEVMKGTYNRNSNLVAQKIIDVIKGREV